MASINAKIYLSYPKTAPDGVLDSYQELSGANTIQYERSFTMSIDPSKGITIIDGNGEGFRVRELQILATGVPEMICVTETFADEAAYLERVAELATGGWTAV